MELLAPAGNIENFLVALEAGADAVYVGAPGINARNLSRDLKLEEIWAMIDHAHSLGKKVYLAANSLILEKEISRVVEMLCSIEKMQPDGLIVQDLSLIRLVQENFPSIPLHASTLMGAHNHDIVEFFSSLGCSRVVLAREMTLSEILHLADKTNIELEVFVHGAMCYSYSGLCLFSSYLGGKSGLRGRCVQPCRRGYRWSSGGAKKRSRTGTTGSGGSYVFSMNDLQGFSAIKELKQAGVTSLKVEGRLRSANYVRKVIEAYRLVLDAGEDEYDIACEEASRLALEAMGRTTSSGYFFSPQPADAILPSRSGNLGLHVGRFLSIRLIGGKPIGKIKTKTQLKAGDRLRLHIGASGERKGFSLKEIHLDGVSCHTADQGKTVNLLLPLEPEEDYSGKVDLYKIDAGGRKIETEDLVKQARGLSMDIKKSGRDKRSKKDSILQRLLIGGGAVGPLQEYRKGGSTRKKGKQLNQGNMELWLKTDSASVILGRIGMSLNMIVLTMDKSLLSQAGKIKKYHGKNSRNIIWALPPVILENEVGRVKKQITNLIRSGFKRFQVAHIGQTVLFDDQPVHLYGDYSLNIANGQFLGALSTAGFLGVQAAIELDRDAMARLASSHCELRKLHKGVENRKKMKLGLTVYGAPPVFVSRLMGSHMQTKKKLVSPKGEEFRIHKEDGLVLTLPEKSFSLLPYLRDIQELGFDYVVIDISRQRFGEREQKEMIERLAVSGKYSKLPTFNYLGVLE